MKPVQVFNSFPDDYKNTEECIMVLGMIVKNEEKTLHRLVSSIFEKNKEKEKRFVNGMCIIDTGSTDKTIENLIQQSKDLNFPLKVMTKPFISFGENRTDVIQQIRELCHFALLMDADMKLVDKGFNKFQDLYDKNGNPYDIIKLEQVTKHNSHPNIRIINCNKRFKYFRRTHEYIGFYNEATPLYDDNIKHTEIYLNTLEIDDLEDGGSKQDKYYRDIKLLELDLIDYGENDTRTNFYLGRSYMSLGIIEKAIYHFKKRMETDEYDQEMYVTARHIAEMMEKLYYMSLKYTSSSDYKSVVSAYLEAIKIVPYRNEAACELASFLKKIDKEYGVAFVEMHKIVLQKQPKFGLFVESKWYEAKWVYLDFIYFFTKCYTHPIDSAHPTQGPIFTLVKEVLTRVYEKMELSCSEAFHHVSLLLRNAKQWELGLHFVSSYLKAKLPCEENISLYVDYTVFLSRMNQINEALRISLMLNEICGKEHRLYSLIQDNIAYYKKKLNIDDSKVSNIQALESVKILDEKKRMKKKT